MTVLPGSLDYLYNYGILECVPYEAYQTAPMVQVGAMQTSSVPTGMGVDKYVGLEQGSVRQSDGYNQALVENNPHYQVDEFTNNKEIDSNALGKVINTPWIKGALAGGIILLTACCLFKSGKKSLKVPQNIKPNLWEKFKGLFKKK